MTLAQALDTGDLTLLPSRRDEDWRWSDLRGLIRSVPPVSPDASAHGEGPFNAVCDELVLVINGGTARIHLAPGEKKTIALRLVSRAVGTAHHAEVVIDLADGAELTLLESHEGDGSGYISNAGLDIRLGDGAGMERIVLTAEAADVIAVSEAIVQMGPRARYRQTILAAGAKRERNETRVTHPGQGADVRLDGAYILGEGHTDLTTVVTHTHAGGNTTQLTKGAVAGQGRGVFQGRIVVMRGADQTDAKMGHHALILDDRAEVDAKPELLIFADDVSCAHGNTVGQLDEAAIFYARQRGIPLAEARAMLTEAFVGEVIDRIEHEGARDVARAWAVERLRGLA